MSPVCLGNIFFASWNKFGWNENRIRLPGSSGVFSTVEAGSEAVLVLAWSDLLGLFADGVSVVF